MPLSTALSRKQNRGRPELTAEEWEEDERALEKAESALQRMSDAMAGRELRLADAEGNAHDVSKKDLEEPPRQMSGWVVMMLGIIAVMAERRERDPDNESWDVWANFLLFCCTGILGPERSINILYDQFGRGVLKRSLNKQRGPTSVHGNDYRRIRIYIDAIIWATGESVRDACRRLAKMGLKVRKDGAQGRVWVNLDNSETIRKRYMYPVPREFYETDIWLKMYETDLLRLKVMWHRSGEPLFLNWLKQLISRETAGPDTMGFFETS